jgi:hypothetical protein
MFVILLFQPYSMHNVFFGSGIFQKGHSTFLHISIRLYNNPSPRLQRTV